MKEVEKTLAEQLQISDREIEHRKEMLYISEREAEVLRSHLPVIEERIDAIVERFYAKQIENTEIALVIGDKETLTRLKGAMRRYILELFSGYYDSDYVNKRLRIGKVHKRIGVSPKLYISAIWLLQTILNEEVDESLHGDSEDEVVLRRAIKEAMNKLIMFDIQMVFDTYIASLVSEVSSAKDELEEYTVSLEEKVAMRTRQLEALSREDSLTGLNNQRTFFETLRHELAVSERHHDEISLIYFDLNGFKKLNDSKGHVMGDEVLKEAGKAVIAGIRETDFGCRYGGDEFCIILPRTTLDIAKGVMDRITAHFRKGETHEVSFSAGITSCGPTHFTGVNELVREADRLMYAAKEKSRKKNGFYVVSKPFKQAAVELVQEKNKP